VSRALLLCLTVGILAGCGDGGCNRANSDDGERNHLGAFNRPTLPTPQQCAYGTAGCPCLPGWKCGEGLRCFGDYCYGGKVPAPDTYFYKDRQFADMHAMRELVLARMDLKAGMKVADLGAGEGFHTLAAALAVGATGTVWATDIMPNMLATIRRKVVAAEEDAIKGGKRVAIVHTRLVKGERDTGIEDLADGSLDVVLMINVLSLFSDIGMSEGDQAYFGRIARKLKPGGRFFFQHDWIRPSMKSRDEAMKMFKEAGFSAPPRFVPMPASVPEQTYEEQSPGGKRTVLKRGYIAILGR